VQRRPPERSGLCGLGGTAGGEQAAQRSAADPADQFHDLAKVRVAGSNPVVRSRGAPRRSPFGGLLTCQGSLAPEEDPSADGSLCGPLTRPPRTSRGNSCKRATPNGSRTTLLTCRRTGHTWFDGRPLASGHPGDGRETRGAQRPYRTGTVSTQRPTSPADETGHVASSEGARSGLTMTRVTAHPLSWPGDGRPSRHGPLSSAARSSPS
jgi:hypothetical protein